MSDTDLELGNWSPSSSPDACVESLLLVNSLQPGIHHVRRRQQENPANERNPRQVITCSPRYRQPNTHARTLRNRVHNSKPQGYYNKEGRIKTSIKSAVNMAPVCVNLRVSSPHTGPVGRDNCDIEFQNTATKSTTTKGPTTFHKSFTVSNFIKTDFGLRGDRNSSLAGWSQLKTFSQMSDLEREMGSIARNDIASVQTTSLLARTSRTRHGIHELHNTLSPAKSHLAASRGRQHRSLWNSDSYSADSDIEDNLAQRSGKLVIQKPPPPATNIVSGHLPPINCKTIKIPGSSMEESLVPKGKTINSTFAESLATFSQL